MQTVQIALTIQLPHEILLPMRLIAYNAGSRKLVIAADALDLPAPIVLWLQQSTLHHTLIAHIVETNTGAMHRPSATERLFHL